MRIAFYAPMKSPDDPTPSGDRQMAQLLMLAMSRGGHDVQLVSKFSSYDGDGDYQRQVRLRDMGVTTATRLIQRSESLRPELRPALWFTYHLYHKAPDWLGPGYCRGMGIPYVVAEASFATKQEHGPWDVGHNAVAEALGMADMVVNINSVDREGIFPRLASPERLLPIKPFTDTHAFTEAAKRRDTARQAMARKFNLDAGVPWLLVVAMMRRGDKLASYHALGQALGRLDSLPFRLIVAGDGEARSQVGQALRPLNNKLCLIGQVQPELLPTLYAASDLYVWPAVNEAYGMAFLEAHAAGLPAVAGRYGGVTDIVQDGVTGIVVPPGDIDGFAAAVRSLVLDHNRRRELGRQAQHKAITEHGIMTAVQLINPWLMRLAERYSIRY